MSSRRLNVLVYNGNGTTQNSLKHVLYTLRRLLTPNYAVLPISTSALLTEPWQATCALIVFPGGADSPYCAALNGEGCRRIRAFVERGGAYVGFCAGGYFGAARCEFEVGREGWEVVGPRELAFFPGICRGLAFPGFEYDSEKGARAAELRTEKARFAGRVPETLNVYYNGGGLFVDADAFENKGVEVLARFTESVACDPGATAKENGGPAAIVYAKVGEGHVVLTSPHPEFSGTNLEVVHAKKTQANWPAILEKFKRDDQLRNDLMKALLTKVGLKVADQGEGAPALTKLYLSSIEAGGTSLLIGGLGEAIVHEDGKDYIRDANDTFLFQKKTSSLSMEEVKSSLPEAETSTAESTEDGKTASKSTQATERSKEEDGEKKEEEDGSEQKEGQIVDFSTVVKRVEVHDLGYPEAKETPYFNHGAFYNNLLHYYSETQGGNTAFGKSLLYGEVVTSTNTMLEKNTHLLRNLPHGFTFTATTQVAGRGRGSNVWVSPAGSLMFSVVMRHEVSLQQKAPVVFIQYLAAMAVVDAVRSYDKGYDGIEVRLKWPNDVYALDPDAAPDAKGPNRYTKIGGILVNSHYSSTTYHSVMGLGLNLANAAPTASLNAVLAKQLPHLAPYTAERLLARILVSFSALYTRFRRTGFDDELLDKYYAMWLHSGQLVTVESEAGKTARICGITSDWGLLVGEEVDDDGRGLGRRIELQSDSNSFDFFKGLVRRKI